MIVGVVVAVAVLAQAAWMPGATGVFSVAQAASGGAPPKFTASVDRAEITTDDVVSLRMTVEIDGGESPESPVFTAPEFSVINQFTSNNIQSYYENGRFGMRHTWQLTEVLRPRRAGQHRITGIRLTVGGKTLGAPDIVVRVIEGGQGTPPPRGYGGAGAGLRGSAKRASGVPFMIRAEVDKTKVFKGEQLVVSYYLYRRTRVFNIQVDKYPMLNGFFREDLEMPVLGHSLESERVVVDGIAYDRSLLVRYAAYPLKDGVLPIDPMGVKAHYYDRQSPFGGLGLDSEDGPDPVMNLFNQMVPRETSQRSEIVNVKVEPLPSDGQPADFAGTVGEIEISASANKLEGKVDEPITFTLQVKGRGNLSALKEPVIPWPTGIEQYEATSRSKSAGGGVGLREFEFLLIPRAPGKVLLPSVRIPFFDPRSVAYRSAASTPIEVQISGEPSTKRELPATTGAGGASASSGAGAEPPREPGDEGTLDRKIERFGATLLSAWRWWLAAGGLFVIGWILRRFGLPFWRRLGARRRAKRVPGWAAIRADLRKKSAAADAELPRLYERMAEELFSAIEAACGINARAMPRKEIQAALFERGYGAESIAPILEFLEHAELVRFAGGAGPGRSAEAATVASRWTERLEEWERRFRRSVSSKK